MKKVKEENIEKFKQLLKNINDRECNLFDFKLDWSEDYQVWVIVDSYEEFYYDGFAFDRIMDELTKAVKNTFGKYCYLDCECPGRWIIAE